MWMRAGFGPSRSRPTAARPGKWIGLPSRPNRGYRGQDAL